MKIILGGALGRMGRQVAAAAQSAGHVVVCGVDPALVVEGSAFPIVDDYGLVEAQADALIDFSRPQALDALLAVAQAKHLPAVLCATGYSPDDLNKIAAATRCIPILQSANMSLGVNVLTELVRMASQMLSGFDVEIIERHHRMKVDSPSGTALMLANAVQEGRAADMKQVFGRQGHTGKRTDTEIGIHAVRGGTVTGEHEVAFLGSGEEILISHRAEDRSLFAKGALTAAQFLLDKPAGLYTMQDVVRELLNKE